MFVNTDLTDSFYNGMTSLTFGQLYVGKAKNEIKQEKHPMKAW